MERTSVASNESSLAEGNFTEGSVPLEEWALHVYFGFVALGGLLDVVYVLGLMRCRRNGILSLVMQLCAIDVTTVCLAIIEILSLNSTTWTFPVDLCPMYNGFEILLNSLTLWLIICLNFQTISLWNLQRKEATKKAKNPLTSCSDESNECLVTKREDACRVLNIDYRKKKDDVSVIIPGILIWFFCVSLSIPNFTLSTVLKVKPDVKICTLIDNYYGHMLQLLLLVFKAILPLPLLIFSFVIVAVKMVKTKKNLIENSTKDFLEIRALLLYCLTLSLCYFITSFQRNVFYAVHMVRHNLSDDTFNVFKFPPLYNNLLNVRGTIALTMLHYGGIVFRAILCVTFLPKFKELIRSKVFVCCKSDE